MTFHTACGRTFAFMQVGLEIVSVEADPSDPTTGVVTVMGPPDIYIAQPGMHMLFLLNGDVYSRAAWVSLERPLPGSPADRP